MSRITRDEIIALDHRFLWHPYTPMDRHLREGPPLVIERARGSRLFDVDGREYIDGNSSWWTALLGHNHPRLVSALNEQSQRMCHVALAGITHEPAARLAAELCRVAPPGLCRVFFSDNGSTALELAVKMSLQYWFQNGRPERRRFLALGEAFHGETMGVTALGGVDVFRRPFEGATMECLRVSPWSTSAEDFSRLAALFEQHGDTLAACVVEPMVQGAGGMRVYGANVLSELRRLTQDHDVLLVADEVFTGYGRTGPMWACEHAGIVPDLMCVAKGFTGGMLPMAATLCSERLFDGFRGADERAFFYGHTYCGHALGAAVAREVLAVYRDERILERAAPKAARLAAAIDGMAQLPGVTQPRALGMVGAVTLQGPNGYLQRAGWLVSEQARQRGVYLRPLGNVVYLAPALNIDDAELELLLSAVHESIAAVAEQS